MGRTSSGLYIAIAGTCVCQSRGSVEDREHTFEERDHGDEPCILGVAMPFRDDDGIFRVRGCVVWASVKRDDFGEIAIKVREVLYGRNIRIINGGRSVMQRRVDKEKLTLTIFPFMDRVASRKRR
jgi:hypothetical protein